MTGARLTADGYGLCMSTRHSEATWRDRWIWWFLAVLLVIGMWIAFDSWRDSNSEDDRQTDRITCTMTGNEDC